MLKIYIAGNSKTFETAKRLANILEREGCIITRKWWEYPFSISVKISSDRKWYLHPIVSGNCNSDFKAIEEADIVIAVCNPQIGSKRTRTHFRGANVEIGYALALNKYVFILGKPERCTLYAKCTIVKDLNDLMDNLVDLDTVESHENDNQIENQEYRIGES